MEELECGIRQYFHQHEKNNLSDFDIVIVLSLNIVLKPLILH